MRTKTLSVLASVAVLAGMASPVLANEAEVSAKASVSARSGVVQVIHDLRAKFQADAKEERQTTQDNIKEKRAELQVQIKERLTTARKGQITKWATRMQTRLNDLVGRLTKTSAKIEVRINALAASGHDVTKLRADLAAARVKIAVAQTAVTSLSAQVQVIVTTNTPKDALVKLRDLQKDVTGKIRQAQQALAQVLKETRNP